MADWSKKIECVCFISHHKPNLSVLRIVGIHSHCCLNLQYKGKTVSWPSYLYTVKPYTSERKGYPCAWIGYHYCVYVYRVILQHQLNTPSNVYIDGLVQHCSNSSALAMELLPYCTKPSIWISMIMERRSPDCLIFAMWILVHQNVSLYRHALTYIYQTRSSPSCILDISPLSIISTVLFSRDRCFQWKPWVSSFVKPQIPGSVKLQGKLSAGRHVVLQWHYMLMVIMVTS